MTDGEQSTEIVDPEKKKLAAEPNPEMIDMGQLLKALKVVNDNVRSLSETVNKHSEIITEMAQIIENTRGSPDMPPQQQQPNGNGGGNGIGDDININDLIGIARNWQQRNQPNPMAELFNRFVSGVIDGQMNMMSSNANLNNAIAQRITEGFTDTVSKKVSKDLSKMMMQE